MEKSKRIKVMHVAQSAGGVEKYLQMFLKYQDNRNFENILVCSYDYDPEEFKDIVETVEMIELQREIGKHDVKAIRNVRKLIKKYKPDIVYAHSSKAGAIVRVANIGLCRLCVYNPHGWAFNMSVSRIKKLLYTVIEKSLAPLCERIICISDAEKRSAMSKKISKEAKLQVIHNGVDVKGYESGSFHAKLTRGSLGIPEDAFVVGMVGRLSHQKAPDVFIQAAQQIKAAIPNAWFIMVGDGEQRDEIQEQAQRQGLGESLLITGWVKDPMSYVELFDVAMLLSRWEGFGLVLAEYMMAGKPVIATRVDAIPEIIIDHVSGLLVKPEDPANASAAVLELYRNAELYQSLAEYGKNLVRENYDVRRVVKEHEDLFLSMLS